jgi:hypothetical protein
MSQKCGMAALTSADKQRNDPAEATGKPHKAENVSDINIVPGETALSLLSTWSR